MGAGIDSVEGGLDAAHVKESHKSITPQYVYKSQYKLEVYW
jgi:hypothetical protein